MEQKQYKRNMPVVSFCLPKEVREAIDKEAHRLGLKRSEVIRSALIERFMKKK